MSNLQTYYNFKLDFQKLDQHTWGKWSIHNVSNITFAYPTLSYHIFITDPHYKSYHYISTISVETNGVLTENKKYVK